MRQIQLVIAWLRRLLSRKKKSALGWPRHVFLHVRDRGIAYGGLVNDQNEASDKCSLIVGKIVMQTGKVGDCNYWTTVKEEFNSDEQAAFDLSATSNA